MILGGKKILGSPSALGVGLVFLSGQGGNGEE